MAHSDDFPDFDIVELPDKDEGDEVTYEGDEVKPRVVKNVVPKNHVTKEHVPKNLVDLDRQIDMCIKYICQRINRCEPSNWYKNHSNFSITLAEKFNYCTGRIDYYIRTYRPYHNVQFRYKMYFGEIIVSMADFIKENYQEDVNVIIVEYLKLKSAMLARDKSEEDIDDDTTYSLPEHTPTCDPLFTLLSLIFVLVLACYGTF